MPASPEPFRESESGSPLNAASWVDCPICGEPDMRREPDGDEGGGIITCTNLACPSNGSVSSAAKRPNPYELAADVLTERHDIKVRKWRSGNSGIAYTNVSLVNEIEAPKPRGPISFAVFAHEVGHIVLHKRNGKYPRWKEEVEAWEFALDAIEEFDLNGYDRAEAVARRCVHYAFLKASRRGADADVIEETFPTWWPKEDE